MPVECMTCGAALTQHTSPCSFCQNKALRITVALLEAIRSAGPAGFPSGYGYAAVMGQMSLDQYQNTIALLKRTGLVKESHRLLTYTGPAIGD